MSDHHDIDSIFKEGLRDFAPQPSPHLWDGIARKVAANRQKRRAAIIWWSAAASLAVLMTVGGALFLRPGNQTQNTMVVADTQLLPGPDDAGSSLSAASEEPVQNPIANDGLVTLAQSVPHQSVGAVQSDAVDSRPVRYSMVTSAYRPKAGGNDGFLPSKKADIAAKIDEDDILSGSLAYRQSQSKKRELTRQLLIPASPVIDQGVKEDKNRRIVLAAVANPAYSSNDDDRLTSSGKMPSANQKGLLALGGGLNVRVHTSSRWSFESGVVYGQIGQTEKSGSRKPVLLMANSFGILGNENSLTHKNSMGSIRTTKGNSTSTADKSQMSISSAPLRYSGYQGDIRQVLDYVEIPLLARYRLLDKWMNVSVIGGLGANILADNNAFVLDGDKKLYVGYTEDVESFVVSSSMGVNIELPLFKSVYFNMEPRFKYFLTPVNSSTGYYPYTFSVLAGVAIHF